jgi:sugar phosphate isomerase/epimerase
VTKPTLTYCTNVHPGETLAEVESSIDRWVVPLARSLAPAPFPADEPFPAGLYLSAASARELAAPTRLARFRDFLADRRIAVVALNCYPFGGFHAQEVKLDVFKPTWSARERVDFTLDAARALAALLPEGATAPISTLAGSCKRFGDDAATHAAIVANLTLVARELERIRSETGREIVLCLEPEPFTTLETTEEAIAFFERRLLSTRASDEAALRRHVGLCFDACHQAVQFEEPAAALGAIAAAGIRVGKMQLSSALSVSAPAKSRDRREALSRYAEARYLHQVGAQRHDGVIERFLDLPELLARPEGELARFQELRVHFHVPIDRPELPPLQTTRSFLLEAIGAARRSDANLFEVETYTFPVLPDGPSDDARLVTALRDELRFAAASLMERPMTGNGAAPDVPGETYR